jgi:hypothetical protein
MAGRPTKFEPKMCEQVKKLCLLGATDAEIADVFGVSTQTFYNWQKEYPEFLEAIKDGKIHADANVAERLYERAMGYTHLDTKFFQHQGEVIAETYEKHYPPDTAAAFIWLKNRRRAQRNADGTMSTHMAWKDKTESELSGPEGGPIEMNIKEIARRAAWLLHKAKKD